MEPMTKSRMTIKELLELLAEYPEDTPVVVAEGRFLREIQLAWVVDQDTNKGSVCLYPKEESSQTVAKETKNPNEIINSRSDSSFFIRFFLTFGRQYLH